jgi:hypothetical protein
VTIGGQAIPVVAEQLQGEEAEEAFERFVELARNYAEYRSRTDRQIRVFRLSAV